MLFSKFNIEHFFKINLFDTVLLIKKFIYTTGVLHIVQKITLITVDERYMPFF